MTRFAPDGESEFGAAARQAEGYARRGLRLTYHWDRDTVVLTIAVPAAAGSAAEEPAVRQAEFVVG